MTILFFDTETTGLVSDWDNPASENNPRLVQLGMQLTDEFGRGIKTFAHIIKPTFNIPAEATEFHGIDNKMAEKYGCPVEFTLGAFEAFVSQADLVVAHNLKFDECVMMGELDRNNCVSTLIEFPKKRKFCTMLESTNVCLIPKKRGSGYKWPKLSEAYMHFFGQELANAHDALTDVMGCKRIYFDGLKKHPSYSIAARGPITPSN